MTQYDWLNEDTVPSEESLNGYPSALRMPHNFNRNTVKEVLNGFLLRSNRPFIITGYTSLKQLVNFISELPDSSYFQLLLGNEPSLSSANAYKPIQQSYPEEVEAYWLSQGLSLRQSLALVRTLQKFELQRVEAQYLDLPHRMLHAKIYLAEDHAAIGSSNFSLNGLTRNIEGNVCFKKLDDEQKKNSCPRRKDETDRYSEVRQFAETLWEDKRAVDYTDTLYELLRKLLRTATWPESLARACAELLEGHWADQYIDSITPIKNTTIWPAQRQGVAQALCVLDQLGSVLLADATGSGKTRLGSVLLRAVHDRIWKKGRARNSAYTTLICPPGVRHNWLQETTLHGLQIQPYSQGLLSGSKDKGDAQLVDLSLKQSQILCVDEAHNYLNESSNRTRFLLRNMADHVILQTATPINKGQSDLLSLINILGADNFDPASIKAFNHYLQKANKDPALKEEHLKKLKKEISRFTIRRTKADFNALIDRAPLDYTDEYQRPCRYPKHNPCSFSTGESDQAISIAEEVRRLAQSLTGIGYIKRKIAVPQHLKDQFSTKELIDWRLAIAKAAAIYQIMSHLRSSRKAALAHIEGGMEPHADHKGIIHELKKAAGTPPGCAAEIAENDIPAWIHDSKAHKSASLEELQRYEEICHLLNRMDASRESTKARVLTDLIQRNGHQIVLAFDRHPVTLFNLKAHITEIAPDIEVIIATGKVGNKLKIQLEERLKPKPCEEDKHPLIVLCSDAMSEGLNFQRASAVVNLDMPSVVRLLEQRVGRIDRMNSLHERIDVYWPDDSKAFALRSDDKLIERHGTVETLLGSNVPLPDILKRQGSQPEDYRAIVDEHARHADDWDEIEDAFTTVRALIGSEGLVDQAQYEQIAKHESEIQVQLTIINDPKPWVFFCIKGSDFSAPKWVMFEDGQPGFLTDFEQISQKLLARLKGLPAQSEPIDPETQKLLDGYLDRVASMERTLLPKRKQVALTEMEAVLKAYRQDESLGRLDREYLDIWLRVLSSPLSREASIDWSSIADHWLDLIRPHWYAELESGRRKRAILLRDIRTRLIEDPIPIQKIRAALPAVPYAKAIESRIVACIITKAESD
ncbi:SNF2-related protein [Marinobacterium lutimaris]|uniref:Helicase conserved C-terminal domain-containing protein n=1 Tax=Marinobacterium lutimaris TaxID=568106 RepID=A0A1H6C0C2_9GAMM|nr:SNF2-related protein [Marinobacterium lutimaris]SEG66177.1 Helicase conserved C-terminal domain-containing protein [Marinobacterium lutimaris]